MGRTIKNAKTIQKKSRSHQVKHVWGTMYQVVSGASGERYNVQLRDGGAVCDCKWGQYRPSAGQFKSGCSHVVAVMDYIAEQESRTVSAWTDAEQAKRQHRPTADIGDGVILTSRVKA